MHLIKIMREKYTFKVDMKAEQYIGIHLDWDYNKRELIASMKGYAQQALTELQHVFSGRFHPAPSRMERPTFGAESQFVKDGTSPLLSGGRASYLQRAIGKFLYYARAIGNTMLRALKVLYRDDPSR